MNMKIVQKYIAVILLASAGITACKKEKDTPPLNNIGSVFTIDSLRHMYQGTAITFTEDYNVYGVVTADEADGNLYKNLYVQNGSAGINLRLTTSSRLYIGDSVRIGLKGTILSMYNGMLQLDQVDPAKNIVKQASGVVVQPLDVNLADINSSLQARLIRINDVEFLTEELSQTYADAVNQLSQNRHLTDCSGSTILVRTSGFANYASQKLVHGHGSLVAVVGQFNSDIQIYIRKYSEISMSGTRCTGEPPITFKNFEDNSITSGGWSIYNVSGTIDWATNGAGSGHSGSYYGQCSNYVGGSNQACDTWFISPSFSLASAVNPALSFINACNYSGPAMEVKVSSNYTSGDPNAATWTTLTPVLSGGSWSWVNSGNLSLSSLAGQSNVHIAFRYTGTSSSGKTWEIDDVTVAEM